MLMERGLDHDLWESSWEATAQWPILIHLDEFGIIVFISSSWTIPQRISS